MLAYAAGRPRTVERRPSPNTMLVIICAHIVVVAAVMSAKMGVSPRIFDRPTTIISVPVRKVPSPASPATRTLRQTTLVRKTHVQTPVVRPDAERQAAADAELSPQPVASVDGASTGIATLPPLAPAVPVSTPAQPLTSPADLKPPYPESKLLAGEEAALTLRLTIDEQGRVVAVEPIGRADPIFLAAARRHLLARWRYKPAMQDGRPVRATVVVTLRFELDS